MQLAKLYTGSYNYSDHIQHNYIATTACSATLLLSLMKILTVVSLTDCRNIYATSLGNITALLFAVGRKLASFSFMLSYTKKKRGGGEERKFLI